MKSYPGNYSLDNAVELINAKLRDLGFTISETSCDDGEIYYCFINTVREEIRFEPRKWMPSQNGRHSPRSLHLPHVSSVVFLRSYRTRLSGSTSGDFPFPPFVVIKPWIRQHCVSEGTRRRLSTCWTTIGGCATYVPILSFM